MKKLKKKKRLAKPLFLKEKKANEEKLFENVMGKAIADTPAIRTVSIQKQAEVLQWLFYTENKAEIARQVSDDSERVTVQAVSRIEEKFDEVIQMKKREMIEEGVFAPLKNQSLQLYMAATQRLLKKVSLGLVASEDLIKLIKNSEATMIELQRGSGPGNPTAGFPELNDEELMTLTKKKTEQPKQPSKKIKRLVAKQHNDDINNQPPLAPKGTELHEED